MQFKSNLDRCKQYIPDYYEDIRHFSEGSYSIVYSAKHAHTNKKFAIKQLRYPFEHPIQSARTLREFALLRHVKHRNIISLHETIINSTDPKSLSDIFFVMRLIPYTLKTYMNRQKLVSEKNRQIQYENENRPEEEKVELEPKFLTPQIISNIIYQVLCAVKYLHSAQITHRDIHPSNIGVDMSANVKILDFGLARLDSNEKTLYVVQKNYRAPELVLKWLANDENHQECERSVSEQNPHHHHQQQQQQQQEQRGRGEDSEAYFTGYYTKAVDMWSVGTILAELLMGMGSNYLFPGNDESEKLIYFLRILGMPNSEMLNVIDQKVANSAMLHAVSRICNEFAEDIRLETQLRNAQLDLSSPECRLVISLLNMNPNRRVSAKEAIENAYFDDLRVDCFEIESKSLSNPQIVPNSSNDYTTEQIKEIITKMVSECVPSEADEDFQSSSSDSDS